MEYRFEEQQSMRFELYDIDKPTAKLSDQDFLGFVECTLVSLVYLPGKYPQFELESTNYWTSSFFESWVLYLSGTNCVGGIGGVHNAA